MGPSRFGSRAAARGTGSRAALLSGDWPVSRRIHSETVTQRTTTADAQALAPVASNARMTIVFVPVNNGILDASHGSVPTAVPAPPVEVCQVTCVIPEPPADVPPTETVAPFAVLTAED